MTNKLDPKGLEAATVVARAECPGVTIGNMSEPFLLALFGKAITAYLAATVPADVAARVARLRRPKGYPVTEDIDLRHEAADLIEAIASRPSPNETLERAAKVVEQMEWCRAISPDHIRANRSADYAAAIRSMKEPE